MGGKKKLSLKQMEKTQSKKDREEKERKERKSGGPTEKKSLGIILPDLKSEKVIGELKTMKVLTPYAIASRFDIRLSIAKDFLEELERRRIVEYVSGSKNLKIYKPLN